MDHSRSERSDGHAHGSKPRHRRLALLGVAVSLALVAAACGDDSDSNTDGASNQSADTAAELNGEPIRIGVVAQVNTDTAPQPDHFPQAELAVEYVNDRGGVNGRPLELVTCDDKTEPAEAALCARKVLQDEKAVALVGGYSSVAQSYLPTLDAADTVWFGNKSVDTTVIADDRVYSLGPGGFAFPILGKVLAEDVDKIGFAVYQSPSSQPALDLFKSTAPDNVEVEGLFVGFTDTDFSPACLKAKQAGVEAIVGAITTDGWTKLANDCVNQGMTDITYATSTAVMSPDFIDLATDADLTTLVAVDQAGSAVDKYEEAMDEYPEIADEIENPVYSVTTNTFYSILAFAELAKNLDTIDGPSIMAYLDQQTAFETGITAPLDFTKPGPVPTVPRIFTDAVQIGTIEDGEIVLDEDRGFVHLSS